MGIKVYSVILFQRTIDGHVQELARFNRVDNAVDVLENICVHIGVGDLKAERVVIPMSRIVNNSIHIQVEVI
jgi:hypothetical protein